MIADVVNPATQRRAGEPYIIARAEFVRTYELVPAVAKKVQPRREGQPQAQEALSLGGSSSRRGPVGLGFGLFKNCLLRSGRGQPVIVSAMAVLAAAQPVQAASLQLIAFLGCSKQFLIKF